MTRCIDPERVASIERLIQKAPTYGIGAEVGVYKGGSLRHIAKAMHPRLVYGFDTFTGLPREHWMLGEVHNVGEFGDTSIQAVAVALADMPNAVLVPGLFPASAEPRHDAPFAFVHIDTDFYLSVKQALAWFWPRMVPGGIIVFDDYRWPNCPGVERALIEFGQPIHQTAQWQAYLVKP